MPYLLLLFIWPLAEIWLLIKVGQQVGAMTTLFLLVATVIVGLLLVQLEWQRLSLLLREKLRQGDEPLGILLETASVGVAGALLILPGFISDAAALLLLIPPTRKLLLSPLKRAGVTSTYRYQSSHRPEPDTAQQDAKPHASNRQVLEGEYQRKDDDRP